VSTPSPSPSPTLAERLNWLFEHIANPHTGKPYSDLAVAKASGVSASTIGRLRDGTTTNPTLETIYALADFFQQPRMILLDDPAGTKVFREMEQLRDLTVDKRVRAIALRADRVADGDPATLDAIEALLTVLEQNKDKITRSARDE